MSQKADIIVPLGVQGYQLDPVPEAKKHRRQQSFSPHSTPFPQPATPEPQQLEHMDSPEARSFSVSGTNFNVPSPRPSIDNSSVISAIRAASVPTPSSQHYTMGYDELESKLRSLQRENHCLRQRLRQGKTQFAMVLASLQEQEQRHHEYEEETEELRAMVDEANAGTADVLEENYSLRSELKRLSSRQNQQQNQRNTEIAAKPFQEQRMSSKPHLMSPLDRQLLHVQEQASRTPAPSPPPLTPDLPEVESPTSAPQSLAPSASQSNVSPPGYFHEQIDTPAPCPFAAQSEAFDEPMPSRRNAVSIDQGSDVARSLQELSLKVTTPPCEFSAPFRASRPGELTPPATPPFTQNWNNNSGILDRISEDDQMDARERHYEVARMRAWDVPVR